MLKKKIPTPKEMLDIILNWSQDRFPLTAQRYGHMNIQGLIDTGILRSGSFAKSYDCDGCGDLGEVIWHESPQNGTRRAYYRCECGLNPVEPEELLTWDIVVPILVQRIGESLGWTAPFREVVPEVVWSFGRKMRHEFYYIRRMERLDVTVIKTFFEPYPKAVLVTPTNLLQRQLKDILPKHLCFSIEMIGTMDEACQLSIDMKLIEAELEPIVEAKKKPMPRRGNRTANIEKLAYELSQHLFASRDHVYEVGDILPRPSLQDLGKMAGLEKHDVTRCMKDKDAKKLQYLWKISNDIDEVRRWKG